MLTVEQAMADYVELIKMIKQTEGLEDRAVIVGGGSYGGMLAAWLRMKRLVFTQRQIQSAPSALRMAGTNYSKFRMTLATTHKSRRYLIFAIHQPLLLTSRFCLVISITLLAQW